MVANTRPPPTPVNSFYLNTLNFDAMVEITDKNGFVICVRRIRNNKTGKTLCYITQCTKSDGDVMNSIWFDENVVVNDVVKVEYKENITLRLTMTKMLTPDPSEGDKFVVFQQPQ